MGNTMVPTTNVLQKTFLIAQGNLTGTAFAAEWKGQEYLVTARHVVPDQSAPLKVVHAEKWKPLPVTGIHHHPGHPDVAVITLNQQVAPRHPVELSPGGFLLEDRVFMLGFPFGWDHTQYDINNGYPMPFVKAAVFSAMLPIKGTPTIVLDGHSNRGFSGGPIIAEGTAQIPKIIGVTSQAQNESTPHPSDFDPPLKQLNGHPIPDGHVHPTNAGFIFAHSIRYAIEVIEANPYGFKMTT